MGGIFPVGNKASETRIYIACLLLMIIFILKILTYVHNVMHSILFSLFIT